MDRKSAFWEKVEALMKKNAEAKAKASGASGGGRSQVKPPSFCKPGIKIDHKPLLQKKSPFDNTYGHSRLRSENGTFYLNVPEKNIEQCFDVQDATLV